MKTFKNILFAMTTVLALTQCRESEKFYGNTLRSQNFVQLYDENKYDFLWVFDNSGSMASRRAFVKDNLQNFVNILNSKKAVDYQMAVTTTDMFLHQGKLLSTKMHFTPAAQDINEPLVWDAGGVTVAKSIEANPLGTMAALINNAIPHPNISKDSSFWEQGLEASYQAVYKYGSEFMRAGVPLIVIYLTDEQDWSCMEECWGVEPENNLNWKPWDLSRYTKYFQNVKKAEDSEVAIFPIVGLNTTDCTIASAGTRYMNLTSAMGNYGVSGSICNSTLKESYEAIAQTIADRSAKFVLPDKASGSGISVLVNDVLIPYSPENYIFDEEANAIIFTGFAPKKNEVITVLYNQLTN